MSEAIAVYSDSRRAEIEKGVHEALSTLAGSRAAAIAKLSGRSPERITELGGMG